MLHVNKLEFSKIKDITKLKFSKILLIKFKTFI